MSMIGLVLVLFLILLLFGGTLGVERFGGYGYGYGHGGIGLVGVLLIILVVLILAGRI